MLNISKTLAHMNIRDTRLGAVQDIRALMEDAPQPMKVAEKFVFDLLGVQTKFADDNEALFTTQAIVDAAIKSNFEVEDGEIALANALRYTESFMTKPENQWMFAVKESVADNSTQEQVSEMIETKVAIKADGSIKKGGRQVLAAELYRKFVIEAEVKPTNAYFKELLVKELGMTSAGASTYAYNCDAEHKMLVKASKGGAKKAA